MNDASAEPSLSRVTSLNLRDCESLRRLSGLDKLTQLTHLNLSWCRNFTEVSELENQTQLTSLDLSGCWDLPRLEKLTRLTSLNLSGCEDLTHIPESIRNMKDLRKLYLCRLTLNELPDWLPEIAEHFTMGRIWSNGENKAVVSFKDTTIKGVDMSIFEHPYEMVVKWFEERKKARLRRLMR